MLRLQTASARCGMLECRRWALPVDLPRVGTGRVRLSHQDTRSALTGRSNRWAAFSEAATQTRRSMGD